MTTNIAALSRDCKPVTANGSGRCSVYYRHPSRGCHKRPGGISPRLLGARRPAPFIGKKEGKVEPKEIPSRSIFRLALGYTRQLRILATALPKGLLQSTQSKLAFKTVTENRRKAQQLNAVYSTHSVLTHFRSSFLCIPVRIRTCRTHQSRCMCLR